MFTPIVIDKGRNLRYGMKAMSLIEKKFGKNLGAMTFDNLTIEQKMIIIWAGLVHEDSSLTPAKLLDLVDANNVRMDTLEEAMIAALNEAFGPGDASDPQAAEEL